MSAVRGTSTSQPDSAKKKVHFEHSDADDLVDTDDNKFAANQSEMPYIRLRHAGEEKRSSFGHSSYNNEQTFSGKFFNISPANTLLFPSGHNDDDGNVILTLINDHSNAAAFKVKTTAPKKYRVRPGNGILPPGTKAEVIITLLAGEAVNVYCQDKFLVLGMEIKDEAMDQIELNELWRTCSKDKIMEHKLKCDQQPETHHEVEASTSQVSQTNVDALTCEVSNLTKEVRSLKITICFILLLQLITLLILMTWTCHYVQWPLQPSSQASISTSNKIPFPTKHE